MKVKIEIAALGVLFVVCGLFVLSLPFLTAKTYYHLRDESTRQAHRDKEVRCRTILEHSQPKELERLEALIWLEQHTICTVCKERM